MLSSQFIRLGTKANRYEEFVSAPVFRKTFEIENKPEKATFTIGTPGFYRLFVNGREITKGLLAPYISNPDHILYYDEYNITNLVREGKNVIAVLAGNGNGSAPGGSVWSFDEFPWTDAAKIAFALDLDGEITQADSDVKCRESHIYFDDLRSGERADGRLYDPAMFTPDYDDGTWAEALEAQCPAGEKKLCRAHPVSYTGNEYRGKFIGQKYASIMYRPHKLAAGKEGVTPQEKYKTDIAYVYDFGINTAGIPVFGIKGKEGQRLEFQFAEYIDNDGRVSCDNINFYPCGYSQRDVYICRGDEKGESYTPSFTYHGARYCAVYGLDDETAESFYVTFRQISSVSKRFADFTCSDKRAETLFDMAVNSDISNFVYFPTDCPQREKNGWTGDAANSVPRMAMFYDVYNDYREWMNCIRKAQLESGEIPAIVPTDKWGYDNLGPSWDKAIAVIPWNVYRFTGKREILEENCEAIIRYIRYLETRLDDDGLVMKDLGDWLCVDKYRAANDKVCAVASACTLFDAAENIFGILGRKDELISTQNLRKRMITSLRAHFINPANGICDNGGQSAQSLAIMHGFFTKDELPKAKQRFIESVVGAGGHLCFGLQGSTSVIPMLFEMGEENLAWNMIMRPDYPSYGHFIEQGLTAMPERFHHDDLHDIDSLNHHMFGNVAQFFIEYVAGLKIEGRKVILQPRYVRSLKFAEAKYDSPKGEIRFRWERQPDGTIVNYLSAPLGTDVECLHTEGEIKVNGKEPANGNRKGYGLFHEAWGRR